MRLAVVVHPRAARSRVRWDGQTLHVWVPQPPVNDAANDAVLRAVAAWSGRPRSAIRIVSGGSSRSKRVEITDGELPPLRSSDYD